MKSMVSAGDQATAAGANLFVLSCCKHRFYTLGLLMMLSCDENGSMNNMTTGIFLSKFSTAIFRPVRIWIVLLQLFSTLDAAFIFHIQRYM